MKLMFSRNLHGVFPSGPVADPDKGRQEAAGIYFIRLDADGLRVSKQAVLVR